VSDALPADAVLPAQASTSGSPAIVLERSGVHLPYLDGIRACAALYVVAFHAMFGFSLASMTGRWRFLRPLFTYGHEAVAIFIVLSGYCLMLPVLQRSPRLTAPFGRFMRRRALRILPPYFAALGVSLAFIGAVPALQVAHGTTWDDSLPAFDAGAIGSHLLLVHNWFPKWKVQINGPLWSVATEWQIYFFFPLLLLPLWRRFGAPAALAVAAAVAYAPLLVFPAAADAAVSWYLLLFAFGMAAATLGFSREPGPVRLARKLPWGVVSGVLGSACAVLSTAAAHAWFHTKPLADVLVGLTTAALLVHSAERWKRRRGGALLRLLGSRALVTLGGFSYSLYLTHLPVLALCKLGIERLGLAPIVAALALLLLGAAASLVFAYSFYVLVERPSLRRR
jgi:peptidoglycan/LPS O-acetylase OafA/YrhL